MYIKNSYSHGARKTTLKISKDLKTIHLYFKITIAISLQLWRNEKYIWSFQKQKNLMTYFYISRKEEIVKLK